MLSDLNWLEKSIENKHKTKGYNLHFRKLHLLILKEWPFFSIAILILLNVSLLYRLSKTKAENQIWKSKIVLSLHEQVAASEHDLEGIDMRNEINKLQTLNSRANYLFNKAKGYVLLYVFRGKTCDRCLNMEMTLFKKQRDLLERLGIDIIITFAEIDQYHYLSLVKLFGIMDITAKDEPAILANRFTKIISPIILLLNRDKFIIAANISDYRDEGKSIRFYEKIFRLVRDN
jgi:hypothetical protein